MSDPVFKMSKHEHSHCIKSAMDRAEQVCAEKSVRLTNLRKRVLELIWQSHAPVKAYDVLEQLRGDKFSSAPPTVYRALEFLQENGLVHKIESLNAFYGCSSSDAKHSPQFLICEDCGNVAEINQSTIEKSINSIAKEQDFTIKEQVIEIKGQCGYCAK